MGKTFTLKGAACAAFMNAQRGVDAETDDDKAMRIATFVHLNMQVRPGAAAGLIKLAASEGLDAAAKICTSEPRPKKKAST